MTSSNIKPLTLHAHASGPNPFKVAIALEYLQVPYTVQMWDFGPDAEKGVKGKKFLAINENGRVPALEDPNTGVTSWESGACINYLRRVYDKKNVLGPKGDDEQSKVDFDKWEYLLLSTLGPMQGQVNWFKHYNGTDNANALERYVAQTYRCYGVLEAQLEKTGAKSILPGGVSAVDLHYHPWVKGYGFAGLSLEKYPNIEKWLGEIGNQKQVQDGYRKVGEAGSH